MTHERKFAPLDLNELNRVNSDRTFAPLTDHRESRDTPVDEATARAFGLLKNRAQLPTNEPLQPTGNFAPFNLSDANQIHTFALPYRPRAKARPLIPLKNKLGDSLKKIYFDDLE